jgi:threonine synthase
MWRYRASLPALDGEPVTLGEGLTPLVESRLVDGIRLLWKDETRNPTGSHKDRALSLAATDARAKGARTMIVVSAGSTGLSNAAYAAHAGLKSIAVVSAGAPRERLFPLHALGSRLIAVDAPIDPLIDIVAGFTGRNGLYVASTTQAANPVQAEAARTIAYEIVDHLGRAPDVVILPVGGGGTMAAIHRGFDQLRALGAIAKLPRLFGVVPSRYNNLRVAFDAGIDGERDYLAMPGPTGGPTVLNKISHDHPPDGIAALRAARTTAGGFVAFDDAEAIAAVPLIGRTDGLYVEPSTAILLPALSRLVDTGQIKANETVVAIACGSGFRETSVMLGATPEPVETVRLSDLETILAGR